MDPPYGSNIIRVETADEMYDAVHASLPADGAVFTAAVADWKIKKAEHRQKLEQIELYARRNEIEVTR